MNPSFHNTILAYRPDIDGIRALAVGLVLAFHAFPGRMPGGFIGVDIFFVISGYLISAIILRSSLSDAHAPGDGFSFRYFYARRILRIFPALIVVLAAVLIAGWFLLLPSDFRALGKHVLAGACFAENFLLWQETGYFDVAARSKPLLNLWSLGIEEQFYIFFPVYLWACLRWRFRPLTLVFLVCALSFIGNLCLVKIDSTATFYLPLTRMWELLAGASLQAMEQQPNAASIRRRLESICDKMLYTSICNEVDNRRALSTICFFFGLFFIGCGLLYAGKGTSLGWKALFPVVGTIFLLYGKNESFLAKLLFSNKIVVFIGKISYPLYLWHWPLLSFAYIIYGELGFDTRLLRVGLLFAAFILSTLTYMFVERPIRISIRYSVREREREREREKCIYIMHHNGYYFRHRNHYNAFEWFSRAFKI